MTQPVYTVTELAEHLRRNLEETFPSVAVIGEISNFLHHGSGHMYFSLKDEGAQMRCALFRRNVRGLGFEPDNGLKVTATGRVSFYPPQGSCQLVVDSLMPIGMGELEIAFQRLKEKLEKEGLFDVEIKKTLPRYPRRIALITSPTGAAVRDVRATLERRWPLAEVVFFPVRVQGAGSATEIVDALGRAGMFPDLDVILLVRGGGSLEDLWTFNEEVVARAIYECPVPLVSGVGHEIDFTIADFVSDLRAPTPTGAAELATPDRDRVRGEVNDFVRRMAGVMAHRVESSRLEVRSLLQGYGMRMPVLRVENGLQVLDDLLARAARGLSRKFDLSRSLLERLTGKLEALSPTAAFERGFTVCVDPGSGNTVRRLKDSLDLESMNVVFLDGRALCDVKGREEGSPWRGRRKN